MIGKMIQLSVFTISRQLRQTQNLEKLDSYGVRSDKEKGLAIASCIILAGR